eukprot:TRINITY_DN2776_c0_g1_i1.p1 TRINITY_DN2776_c0_g1~~TRINITY_DN2776_c0_g1_i1.p1  ORF type:complete len:710 (+),score=166.16 TRINITY_DN2776_c0_g1_i1:169-2130(+)
MGFLSEGNTFGWSEASVSPIEFVKAHGVIQFINFYEASKNRKEDPFKWGDEVEYIVVKVNSEEKKTVLNLRGNDILHVLGEEERIKLKEKKERRESTSNGSSNKKMTLKTLWRPEYAKYMVEGTPGKPYGKRGLLDLISIEDSMKERRETVEKLLNEGEQILTMTNYPLLGATQHGSYTFPETNPGGEVARSYFTSDSIINSHFRFSTLTNNIMKRRGSKVNIQVPLYKDTNTDWNPLRFPTVDLYPFSPPSLPPHDPSHSSNSTSFEGKEGVIYMDSMAFGMGCCCLQTTFQLKNIDEARWMYDQFAVLSPIMLALTAGTPIFRGYLSDIDVRWSTIAASVDDRTEEERGLKPLQNNKYVINKSRYDSIDCFIANDQRLRPQYNDLDLVFDSSVFQTLSNSGIDEKLSRHISHLFIRDPLVIYRDKLTLDDKTEADHFENIQSTNWQTVRFKIPPPNTSLGWRVEFRPMEVQFTDFENAALVVWTILMVKAIQEFGLLFYIPITKVDENMKRAHQRDANTQQKFFFRTNIEAEEKLTEKKIEEEYEEMSMREIFHGNSKGFKGILYYLFKALETIPLKDEENKKVQQYLNFIGKRATGELQTNATWIRNFVQEHPDYKKDSIITHSINYDLLQAIHKIESGQLIPPQLYPLP